MGMGRMWRELRVPFLQCFVVHRVFAFCLDVCWHDFARNADIRRITNRPPLSSITNSRRLTFFGHLARMDENADASQAIFEPPPENWRRLDGKDGKFGYWGLKVCHKLYK